MSMLEAPTQALMLGRCPHVEELVLGLRLGLQSLHARVIGLTWAKSSLPGKFGVTY